MKRSLTAIFALLPLIWVLQSFSLQEGEPWSENQLMPPSELAERIERGETADLHILGIGPAALIEESEDIGETKKEEKLKKLESTVDELPRDAEIVLYCGCCPFKDCPNIRPAFSLLNELGFTRHKLLDLPENLKVDWIDKGYPTRE